MEKAVSKGYYLAGFMSYEAGYSFEDTLNKKELFDFPLLCFGIYLDRKLGEGKDAGLGKENRILGRTSIPNNQTGIQTLPQHPFNLSEPQYQDKINKIQDYISKGDTYQITFCVKKKFDYQDDPYSLYGRLLDYQAVPYPAYIKHKDFGLLSLSPEMFLKKTDKEITVKPMKGTLIRDGSFINNLYGKAWLHRDPKNRAENIMITDLLRNDLGRICDKGSVITTKLCEVAKYRTVFQMTSTIKGNTDKNIPIYDVFKALFPSGSVTGAPKIRAMEIIRELESEERKIYTGAIGYITPNRDMFFNVPIRTILLKDGHGEMGIGGGITWYSTPEGEYDECLIKARFLKEALV